MSLLQQLRQETLFARQRVYRAGDPTPLEKLPLDLPLDVFVKREDVSAIKAYKWRGAFNRMALLTDEEKAQPVVTASAGNHAQGVALAARILGLQARIYMPRTTPGVKLEAVRRHGGDAVEILQTGDGYDDALSAAVEHSRSSGSVYIHAYDDIHVMAGQATLADEVVMSGEGPFDLAYLQIGGGGMAAGVANWLKTFNPDIRIVGVEGERQASMKAALAAGSPVRLDDMDIFCDGTAVRRAGDLPYQVCRELLDDIITVSNEEVSDAIRILWERLRCLQEPSGAMGLAGLLKDKNRRGEQCALVVACGANLDFGQLARIADSAGIGHGRRRYLRIEISEKPGSMLALLETGLGSLNIIDFQYGKIHETRAWPVFGMACTDLEYEALMQRLREGGFNYGEADSAVEVRYRAISCDASLLSHPLFLELDFYERPGALHAFLEGVIRGRANFCYFNYHYSGERVGRALIGLEFENLQARDALTASLPSHGEGYRHCRVLSPAEASRITGLVSG